MPRSLRPATPDDVPFLVDVLDAVTPAGRRPGGMDRESARAAWAAAAAREIAGELPGSITSVLEDDGVAVGRVRVVRGSDVLELAGLQVRPEHQGRGLGTGVVLDLQAEATEAGTPLELRVEHANPRARALYERLGLRHVADEGDEALLRRAPRPLTLGPDAEFRDPVLAALYDTLYGWGRDDQSFLDFIGEDPGCRVLDLGCGTGRVTLALAAAGHTVTGIDPAGASLERLRARPGADAVTTLEGYADRAPTAAFDAALLTAHVAQFIVTDAAWEETLAHLHRALVPGGRLTFDTRDPGDRAWERWAAAAPDWTTLEVDGAPVTVREWLQIRRVVESPTGGAVVAFRWHNAIGEERELWSDSTMRWRTEAELRASLTRAGFVVDAVHGGWDGGPPPHADGELIVRAHRV